MTADLITARCRADERHIVEILDAPICSSSDKISVELVQTSHTIIAKEKKLILVIVLGFSANAFAISDECERILILQAQFEILAKDSAEQLNMDQAVVTDVQARNEDFVVSIPVLYTKRIIYLPCQLHRQRWELQ